MIVTYQMLKKKITNYKNSDNKIKRMSYSGEIVKLTKNLYETSNEIPDY